VDLLKLYYRFALINIKSRIEYRFAFFMDLFVQFTRHGVNYLSIWIIINKFSFINGWSFYEMMVLYNLNLLTYAICGLFFWRSSLELSSKIQTGNFDSFLIKPISPYKYLVMSSFTHEFIGHIIISSVVLTYSFCKLLIEWNVIKVVFLVLMIMGAVVIHSTIMIITSSMSFWFVKSNAAVEMTIYDVRRFIEYPISIYDKWIKFILTFIIPYSFVNYYPCLIVLNKPTEHAFPTIYFYPLILVLLIIAAVRIWARGISKYQSTGS